MNGRVLFVVVAGLVGALTASQASVAQTMIQPTPKPIYTADNEVWYQAGVPITFAGNIYYPAGPIVHFNANEMVRSGHYQGIPLYSRTTIEPFSIFYVPLYGGLMQPYERRRAGDVADTTGSMTPSFPVVRSAEQSNMEYVPGAGVIQAQAPPSWAGAAVDRTPIEPTDRLAGPTASVGTAGGEARVPLGPLATAKRPEGLNGVFVEYDNQRYFSDGPAREFDAKSFTRIGEYHGFAVYRRDGEKGTIYIPPLAGSPTIVAPYRAR
jgi:hypothetical protein